MQLGGHRPAPFYLTARGNELTPSCRHQCVVLQECCNGTVVDDDKSGQVLQLQGDQRDAVSKFLSGNEIVEKKNIKVHGAG